MRKTETNFDYCLVGEGIITIQKIVELSEAMFYFCQWNMDLSCNAQQKTMVLLLMEEILHHLGCIKPCK